MNRHLITLFLSSVLLTTQATAGIIVDFTETGGNFGNANGGGLVFSSQDLNGTGVSFDITASAVIPAGGQQNPGGNINRINAGIGSLVENTGTQLNRINGIDEVLQFTISNVAGLAPGQSIVLANLLSQNGSSTAADQSGGTNATFGQVTNDNLLFTSDLGPTVVVNQSDTGDLGSILLNTDNNDATTTGNTFEHSAGNLAFTNSFTVQQNNGNFAAVIQGFDFEIVIPEPSAALFVIIGGFSALLGRRKRRLE